MATLTTNHAALELRDRLATLGVSCDIVPTQSGVQLNLSCRETYDLVDRFDQITGGVSARQEIPGQLSLF